MKSFLVSKSSFSMSYNICVFSLLGPLQSRRSFNENVLKIDEPNVVVTTPG